MSWPQWPTAGVAPPTVVQGPVINSAPNVANPTAAAPSQYTPEQWTQMQQHNWQQWAQWQQQFQQWQQQYGAEYQKSMNAMAQQTRTTAPQPTAPYYNIAPPTQPPLPVESKPPPPPDDSHGPAQPVTQQHHQMQQPPLPQTAPPTTTSVYLPSQYSQPPPLIPTGYSSALPPQSAPPPDPYRYNQNQQTSTAPKTQAGFDNRNFDKNQNYNQNRNNSNWQNQANRNQGPAGDYGVKRPFNQQYNERPDMKRNKLENQSVGKEWQGNNQRAQRWSDPSGNQRNQRWGDQDQYSQNQEWDESQNQIQNKQQYGKPSYSAPKPNPDEPSEAEKKFDKQFAQWEAQFQKWKSQNANHPDKSQYQEYEKKWVTWRAQLLERREQMRRKRLGLTGNAPKSTPEKIPPLLKPDNLHTIGDHQRNFVQSQQYSPSSSRSPPPPIPSRCEEDTFEQSNDAIAPTNEPAQHSNSSEHENLADQTVEVPKTEIEITSQKIDNNENSEGFLQTSSGDGIPGLDLVKDAEVQDADDAPTLEESEEQKKSNLDAISRGINSILGNQNLLNMLSFVSQAPSTQVTDSNVQNTTAPASNSPKFSPEEYNEYSNQGNVDDQSQSSFNANNAPIGFNRPKEAERNFNSEQNIGVQEKTDFNEFARNNDTFNRGPASFDRGRENLNRPFNDFNSESQDFNSGPGNFDQGRNQGHDNFSRGFENSNRNSDNFNRGPNFNRGSNNFNQERNTFQGPEKSGGNANSSKGPPSLFDLDFSKGFGNFKGLGNFGKKFDNFNKGMGNRDGDWESGDIDESGEYDEDDQNTETDNFRSGGANFNNNRNLGRGNVNDNFNKGFQNNNRRSFDKFSSGGSDNRGGDDNFQRGGDNFGRGGDNFGRDGDNFGRGGDNFGRGGDNFGRGGDNFGRGGDNFGRGGDNFGRGRDNFGRGGDNFGRGGNNFSRGGTDNFDRDGNNFGRGGPNNLNRNRGGLNRGAPDRFNKNQSSFYEDSENSYQEPPNFPRPANDFDRGPDNFSDNQSAGKNSNAFDAAETQDASRWSNLSLPSAEVSAKNAEVPAKTAEVSAKNVEEAKNEEIWKPSKVTEYDHKPLKSEPDVLIVPINMFDYRHKLFRRIPYPQRPKWLSDTVKNFPEFDVSLGRQFESQTRFDNRDRKGFDDRKSYADRDRNFFEDRKSLDGRDWDRKSFEIERSNKNYDDRNRKSMEGRDGKYFDERDQKFLSTRDKDRKSDDRDRKSFDDRERRSYDDRDRKSYDDRDRKSYDDRDRKEKKYDDRDRRSYDDRKHSNERDRRSHENRSNNLRETEECIEIIETDNEEASEARSTQDSNSENVGKNKGSAGQTLDFLKSDNKAAVAKKNVTAIEDLLYAPGRFKRPPSIVIILRGPPGSGKSHLAKIIKDKEVENGGSTPRIICLDDYFMVEQDKEIEEDGNKVRVKEMVYEYEECMEASYRQSLMKSFKKTITDGYFNFIIVDNVNDKVKYFGEMWSFAKQNGFQVYICEMGLDVQACTKRNIHGRSEIEIERCVAGWEPTPSHHPIVDASCLLQTEDITEVEMEDANSPTIVESNIQEHIASKWDTFDVSVDNLAKLDGISKPFRATKTMEDYLQSDEWSEPVPTKPGQKRVRWADLEEHKKQEKMRAIGFVVGHTNWDRMMDPTKGSSALTQTKYIERYK